MGPVKRLEIVLSQSATEGLPLQLPADYAAARPSVFPSRHSYRWFERQHKAELVAGGALVMPTGRKLVNPEAFDRVVLDVGARRAGGK